MKIAFLAVVALSAATINYSDAFAPSGIAVTSSRPRTMSGGLPSLAVDMAADTDTAANVVDVSVPYDAAARLAYEEWIAKNNKPYDEARYQVFRANYNAVTVMNVSAKRAARESGGKEEPTLLSLNEFADCTAEEYEAALGGGGGGSDSVDPTSTGDILGEAVDAVESQMAASSALQEAADALAEEEEMLAAQLGLESIEELEAAIDSMDGISPDGTEIEGENLAREARVRSAYLDWCKEFNKKADEARFPQFMSNFLEMEEFAKENGKEMILNEYADYTEAEYIALTATEDEKVAAAAAAAKAEADKEAAARAAAIKAEQEAAAKAAAEKEAAIKAEKEAKAAAIKAEAEKKRKEAEEERRKQLAEAARLAAMSEEERRQEIEKEKAARQSAQAKELEKAAAAAEAEAIAAALAATEAAAEKVAEARRIQEEAAEIARAKAKEWEERQARLRPAAPTPAPAKSSLSIPKVDFGKFVPRFESTPKQEPPKKDVPSFFGALEGLQKQVSAPAKKASPVAKKAAPSKPVFDFGPFFDDSDKKKAAPAKKVAPAPSKPVTKTVPPKSTSSAPRPTLNLASIFESKPSVPAPKKAPAPAPNAAPAAKASAPRPTLNLASIFETKSAAPAPKKSSAPAPAPELKLKTAPKISTSDPVTEAFASFFGGSKTATPSPKAAPQAPKPAPEPKNTPAPSFSFFNSKPPAKAATPAPTPVPEPKKAPAPSFSFFNSKPPAKTAAPVPKPEPTKPAQSSFSFFGGPSKPAAKKPAPTPTKPEVKANVGTTSRPTLSLFAAKPKAEPKPTPAPAAPAKSRSTFSIFGMMADSEPAKKGPATAAAPKDTIPALSKWVQNDDGSITGLVSNSPNFRNGTRITTSPVRKGAQAGSVVKTGSGSQYRLN